MFSSYKYLIALEKNSANAYWTAQLNSLLGGKVLIYYGDFLIGKNKNW